MSAEGDAVAAPPPVEEAAAPAEITRFADLDKLGIDQRIIDSITRGMGYETMSEVQSKTVSPALTGKDMYAPELVFLHFRTTTTRLSCLDTVC